MFLGRSLDKAPLSCRKLLYLVYGCYVLLSRALHELKLWIILQINSVLVSAHYCMSWLSIISCSRRLNFETFSVYWKWLVEQAMVVFSGLEKWVVVSGLIIISFWLFLCGVLLPPFFTFSFTG